MTTESQTPTSATEPQAQPAPVSQEPSASQAPSEEAKKLANDQLRAYADRLESENKGLKTLAMRSALGEIGLNPEEGLGLAIVESYDGEISDDAIASYASTKYKHGAQVQPGEQQTTVTATTAAEQLAAVGQSVTPQPQVTPGEQVVQKVDSGDPEVTAAEALMSVNQKAAQFAREHYGPKQT